jgi:hypothetical protein
MVVVAVGYSPLRTQGTKVLKGLNNPNGQLILTKLQQTQLRLIPYSLSHIPSFLSIVIELTHLHHQGLCRSP